MNKIARVVVSVAFLACVFAFGFFAGRITCTNDTDSSSSITYELHPYDLKDAVTVAFVSDSPSFGCYRLGV